MQQGRTALAGTTAALAGFASSSSVVLAGLVAVGATPTQAASGLVALCVVQALAMMWLSWRTRIPVLVAWSTPGAALLAAGAVPGGGFSAAVGAFIVSGILILLTGLWPALSNLVSRIPAAIAQAMLAGILVGLCLAPVREMVENPLEILPIIVVWLVLMRLAPTWAAPAAFAVGLLLLGIDAIRAGGVEGRLLPVLEPVVPTVTWGAVIGIALPLYVVTMAGQNIPGVAILSSYGYTAPWRQAMTVTGIGTIAGAPVGGLPVNLGAITAAITASPDAHPDPGERWKGVRTTAFVYFGIAVCATALTTLVGLSPGILASVAGLALIPTLGSSIAGAVADARPGSRTAAIVTFVVGASGIAVAGIGSAFWALAAGLVVYAALAWRR